MQDDMKVLARTVTSPKLDDPTVLDALIRTDGWQTLMTFTRETIRKRSTPEFTAEPLTPLASGTPRRVGTTWVNTRSDGPGHISGSIRPDRSGVGRAGRCEWCERAHLPTLHIRQYA